MLIKFCIIIMRKFTIRQRRRVPIWDAAAGEMSKTEALETLDELEKKDNELITEIDREIERLEEGPQGDQGDVGRPLGDKSDWRIWLMLIPIILLGSITAWIIISSLRGG